MYQIRMSNGSFYWTNQPIPTGPILSSWIRVRVADMPSTAGSMEAFRKTARRALSDERRVQWSWINRDFISTIDELSDDDPA